MTTAYTFDTANAKKKFAGWSFAMTVLIIMNRQAAWVTAGADELQYLNRKVILCKLDDIIMRYGEVNEENETDFLLDVERLISQMEIYDQV